MNPSLSNSNLKLHPDKPADRYILSLTSQMSRKRINAELCYIARFFDPYNDQEKFDWASLDYDKVLLLRNHLIEKNLSPSSINFAISTVKSVCKECWKMNLIDDNTYLRIKSLPTTKGTRITRGRSLSQTEISLLLQQLSNMDTVRAIRDMAILSLGCCCGLRRSEITAIRLNDFDELKQTILIHGKGNKERLVYVHQRVIDYLKPWIALRGRQGCEFLFVPVQKNNTIVDKKPLTTGALYATLRAYGTSILNNRFSPHDLRRTFATRLFEEGTDINLIRQAMGHTCITTTQLYDKRSQDELKKVLLNQAYLF